MRPPITPNPTKPKFAILYSLRIGEPLCMPELCGHEQIRVRGNTRVEEWTHRRARNHCLSTLNRWHGTCTVGTHAGRPNRFPGWDLDRHDVGRSDRWRTSVAIVAVPPGNRGSGNARLAESRGACGSGRAAAGLSRHRAPGSL